MKPIICFVFMLWTDAMITAQYEVLSNDHGCGVDESTPYFDPYTHSPPGNSICTDPEVIRYIPLVFHFLLHSGSTTFPVTGICSGLPNYTYFGPGNFNAFSDGHGSFDYTGYDFVDDIIEYANAELASNSDQWRKDPQSSYPAAPPSNNIRYISAGVYFHYDADAYNLSITRANIHQQYSINQYEYLNVYFTGPALPYSGIANSIGGSLKYNFNDLYLDYLRCSEWANTRYSGQVLNHEIGHNLSLRHTWNEDDLCNDTPRGFLYDHVENPNDLCPGSPTCCIKNANCWRFDNSASGCPLKPCDESYKISNNIMDYNQYDPHAYTSCQIDRINADLFGQGNTYIYSCSGCMPSMAFFSIDEAFVCQGQATVILDGQGSFNETEFQIEVCEINPSTGLCVQTSYLTGWIDGEMSFYDLSEEYDFNGDTYYKIKLVVDNEECAMPSTYEATVMVKNCTTYLPNFEFDISNPRQQTLEFEYTVGVAGTLTCALVNASTGHTTIVMPLQSISPGVYSHSSSIAHLPAGSYFLLAYLNGSIAQTSVIKI